MRLAPASGPGASKPDLRRFSEIFHVLFLCLILVLPLLRGAWDQWAQTLVASLWAFFLLWGGILWGLRRGEAPFPLAAPPKLLWAFAIGALAVLVSALASRFPHSAVPAALNDWTGFLFFFLTAGLPGERRAVYGRALAGAGLLAVLSAILGAGAAAAGPLVNPNILAGLLVLVLPLAAVFAFKIPASRKERVLWALAIAVGAASLLHTASLIGYLVLSAEGFVIYLWLGPGRRRAGWLAGALGLVAAAAGLWLFRAEWVKFLGEPDRWAWWRTAAAMCRTHPLWGVGPGAYGEAYPAFRVETWGLNSLYAHNFLLETLAERGIVFSAALAALLFHTFRRGWSSADALDRALVVGLSGFCLYNLVHVGFSFPALAWLFWAAAGLVWAGPASAHPRRKAFGWALALAGGGLGFFSWALFRSSQWTARAREALRQADYPRARAWVEKGLAWNPLNPELYDMRAALHFGAGDSASAAADMAAAVRLAPASAGFRRDAGELAARGGDMEAALGHYGEAVRLLPLSADLWTRRGDLLAGAGRREEARDSYNNALRALSDPRVLGGDAGRRAASAQNVRARLSALGYAPQN